MKRGSTPTQTYPQHANLYQVWIAMFFQFLIIFGVLYWCSSSFKQRAQRMWAWWCYWGTTDPPIVENRMHVPHGNVHPLARDAQAPQKNSSTKYVIRCDIPVNMLHVNHFKKTGNFEMPAEEEVPKMTTEGLHVLYTYNDGTVIREDSDGSLTRVVTPL